MRLWDARTGVCVSHVTQPRNMVSRLFMSYQLFMFEKNKVNIKLAIVEIKRLIKKQFFCSSI